MKSEHKSLFLLTQTITEMNQSSITRVLSAAIVIVLGIFSSNEVSAQATLDSSVVDKSIIGNRAFTSLNIVKLDRKLDTLVQRTDSLRMDTDSLYSQFVMLDNPMDMNTQSLTNVNIDSGTFDGSTVTASGAVTGGSLTDGTATLSSGALSGATTVTASGAVTGGSLTDGTATLASGALSGATSVDGSGDLTMGTVTMTGFGVDADGDVTSKSLDNTSGGITNAGAISGATTVTASGAVTGGSLTDGTATLTGGVMSGITGINAGGALGMTAASLTSNTTGNTSITVDDNGVALFSNAAGDAGLQIVASATPAAEMIYLVNTAGTDNGALTIKATAGGIDMESGTQTDIIAGTHAQIKATTGFATLDGFSGVNIKGNAAEVDVTTTGAVDINSANFTLDASGSLDITSANTALTVASGTGTMNVSSDAAATAVNIATGAGVKALTLGSTNTTSSTTIQTGTGAMAFIGGGALTFDGASVSIDGTDDSNLTMTANAASTKTLTIAASNSGAGVADIDMDADGAVKVDAPAIDLTGVTTLSGTLNLPTTVANTAATTHTVVDNTASAYSIGSTGKTDILKVVSTDAGEGVTMSGTLGVTGLSSLRGIDNAHNGIANTGVITQVTSISTAAAATALPITATGILTLDGNGGVNVVGNAAEVDVTTTGAVDVNGAAITMDASAGMSLDAAAASNLTTSAGALTLDGAAGLNIGTNADQPIDIDASTLDIDASGAITIDATSTTFVGNVVAPVVSSLAPYHASAKIVKTSHAQNQTVGVSTATRLVLFPEPGTALNFSSELSQTATDIPGMFTFAGISDGDITNDNILLQSAGFYNIQLNMEVEGSGSDAFAVVRVICDDGITAKTVMTLSAELYSGFSAFKFINGSMLFEVAAGEEVYLEMDVTGSSVELPSFNFAISRIGEE